MIKFDISENFLNPEIDYPFNIFDVNGNRINDFWGEISSTINLLTNDRNNKIRLIWIEAEGYCQTEVFLKKILVKHSDNYPVLYLHWIDYVDMYSSDDNNPIATEIKKVMIDDQYYSDMVGTKICIIDHAEEIVKLEHLTNLCETFRKDSFVFIFISKRGGEDEIEYWNRILSAASNNNDDDKNTGILRSKDNFYRVTRYSVDECKAIIERASIIDNDIKSRCCSLMETLNDDLRRAYYFDLFLKYVRSVTRKSKLITSINNTTLLENIYSSAIKGVIRHLRGHSTLEEYIKGYYSSDFVANYQLDKQRRIPIDSYAWAHGIVEYTPKQDIDAYYESVIKFILNSIGTTIESFGQVCEIICHVVNYYCDEKGNKRNKYFSIKDCLIVFSKYSRQGALLTSTVLSRMLSSFDVETVHDVFKAVCDVYMKPLLCEDEILVTVSIGYIIGNMIPKLPNEVIADGLSCFFAEVEDDYVYPVCNENGISAVSVTNYEFEKFVADDGYRKYYEPIANESLKEVAARYYQEIIDFIFSALGGESSLDSQSLMILLKGYDWFQLKQLAILYSNREKVSADRIKMLIQDNNYPHPLAYPAKWSDPQNSNPEKPFCNPLEPVVCVNYFEGLAYAAWLSDKINKPVRLVKYDPDYISLIGSNTNSPQRTLLLEHIKKNQNYFNTVENGRWFYGDDDITVREPVPVSLPNSYFCGTYDFLGNVFETQQTVYTYNYDLNVCDEAYKEFESRDKYLIDYNCPCGGLQRTKANLPPVYMGQVPAFLRNQDIGFRIVICGNEETGDACEKKVKEKVQYGSCSKVLLTNDISANGTFDILDGLTILSIDETKPSLKQVKIFANQRYRASLYSLVNENVSEYNEYILLLQDEDSVYAYRLSCISVVEESNLQECLSITIKYPIVSTDYFQRKKNPNIALAGWIDYLQIIKSGYVETYLATPLNISCSYFSVGECVVKRDVVDGKEINDISSLVGNYKITFSSNISDLRAKYYNSIKARLGIDFFLPDWIDIVDFIGYIIATSPSENEISSEDILAAITTIDTSDLHEQISSKKIRQIDERMRKENE